MKTNNKQNNNNMYVVCTYKPKTYYYIQMNIIKSRVSEMGQYVGCQLSDRVRKKNTAVKPD